MNSPVFLNGDGLLTPIAMNFYLLRNAGDTPMKRTRPYDMPDYRRRRQELMAAIGPDTRCGRCGRLFGEHPPHASGWRGRWEVGHVVDGNNAAPLRIEHSTCNRAAGGQVGNERRWRPRAPVRHDLVPPHDPAHYSRLSVAPCQKAAGRLCAACREYRTERLRRFGGPVPHLPQHYNPESSNQAGRPPCMDNGGELCPTCRDWHAANPQPKRRGISNPRGDQHAEQHAEGTGTHGRTVDLGA